MSLLVAHNMSLVLPCNCRNMTLRIASKYHTCICNTKLDSVRLFYQSMCWCLKKSVLDTPYSLNSMIPDYSSIKRVFRAIYGRVIWGLVVYIGQRTRCRYSMADLEGVQGVRLNTPTRHRFKISNENEIIWY